MNLFYLTAAVLWSPVVPLCSALPHPVVTRLSTQPSRSTHIRRKQAWFTPGVIITDGHRCAGLNEEQYSQFLQHTQHTHALGHPGTVDEVARMIAFMASDAASFITGVTVPVDGGRHTMCPR
ncbi:hypothetical protein FKM82_022997 [Ascaphus truei]